MKVAVPYFVWRRYVLFRTGIDSAIVTTLRVGRVVSLQIYHKAAQKPQDRRSSNLGCSIHGRTLLTGSTLPMFITYSLNLYSSQRVWHTNSITVPHQWDACTENNPDRCYNILNRDHPTTLIDRDTYYDLGQYSSLDQVPRCCGIRFLVVSLYLDILSTLLVPMFPHSPPSRPPLPLFSSAPSCLLLSKFCCGESPSSCR